jgi:hypothetical protein
MDLNSIDNMVVPVETNGEILTLKDEEHWMKNFESCFYLPDKKMLLKGNSNSGLKENLIMCIKLEKKPSRCN